ECGGKLVLRDRSCFQRGACGRKRKNVHRKSSAGQEIFGGLQLRGIFVGRGQRGVGGGETVGVHFAGNVPHVVGGFERHVAIGALLRLRGVIERARALSGNAAGLPVVVLIETVN